MAGFDILALAVIGMAAVFGLVRGFFHQLLKVTIVGGALALMFFFLPDISGFLSERVGIAAGLSVYLVVIISFVVIFIGLSLLMHLARKPVGRVKFGGLDKLAGGVLGFAKGVGILAVITFALVSFPDEKAKTDYLKRYVFKESWTAPRIVIAMGYIRPAFQEQFFVDAEEMMKREPVRPTADAANSD